jgi:hypothetical protein
MLVEGPKFRLWISPNLSSEEFNEAASAICRILVDPPQSPRHRRSVAVRTAMSLYSGSRYARAKTLESRYRSYLAGPWRLERGIETLPDPRSAERVLLHRLARCNGGHSLGWRQLFDIANCPQG